LTDYNLKPVAKRSNTTLKQIIIFKIFISNTTNQKRPAVKAGLCI